MKILDRISPKRLLKSDTKSRRSVSRSEPSSSSSGWEFSSSSGGAALPHHRPFPPTPTSALPSDDADGRCEAVEAFRFIDRDGDGKVTTQELEALLHRVGAGPPCEAELRTMLTELDRDGDGCICLQEFAAVAAAFAPARRSELREVFGFFDKDQDGQITAEELLQVFEAIGDEGCTIEDCRRMISGVDKTGDGFVCFEDFTHMMEAQC